MTPLRVAEKLWDWVVLERGIVKFTASTKQLWTTRLGIAHNTIQSSLSLSLSLSSFHPFSSSPSFSHLVFPLLRSTYIWDPLICRNVLAHDVTTNIISCRPPWAVIYDTADWNPTCELVPGVFQRDACPCIYHIWWCQLNLPFWSTLTSLLVHCTPPDVFMCTCECWWH